MRIGISGAQSVGKTTLMNAMRSEHKFKRWRVCDEVTRRVSSYGLPINENGNDLTQRLIMQEHIANVFMYDKFIADRTALDGYVYTKWLYSHGKVKSSTLQTVREIFKKVQPYYDIQFYIRPEFEVENDGVRSINLEFRDEIVKLFDLTIKDYELPVHVITGSVRERIDQILKVIDEQSTKTK